MLQMATLQLHAWTLGVPGADSGILALCLDTGHFKLNVGISALRLQHLSQLIGAGSRGQGHVGSCRCVSAAVLPGDYQRPSVSCRAHQALEHGWASSQKLEDLEDEVRQLQEEKRGLIEQNQRLVSAPQQLLSNSVAHFPFFSS